MQANAEQARDDPSAVAYIGELGLGASADLGARDQRRATCSRSRRSSRSRASPGRRPAAPPAALPTRYYPTGRRTFLRLVPNDLREADLITARVSELGAERVALVTGEGVYAEELASQLAERLRRDGRTRRADGRDRRRPEGTAIARGRS